LRFGRRVYVEPTVVIPVYNEGENLRLLVNRVSAFVPPKNIVVVDDGSRPGVSPALVTPARLLRHPINLGKGMALKTGCEFALKRGAEAILLMDGDGQHDPSDIPRITAALDEADIVFAARELSREMPPVRLMGNWVLNRCVRVMFGRDLQDIWCGYRAFRAEFYEKIAWNAHDYAVDVEMAVRALKHRLKHREIRIATVYHDAYKGVTVVDGLRLLIRLVGWKFTL